jgi:hypothetical protein
MFKYASRYDVNEITMTRIVDDAAWVGDLIVR